MAQAFLIAKKSKCTQHFCVQSSTKLNDVDLVLAWAGLSASDAAEIRKLFGTAIRMGSKADFQNSKMSETGIEIWRSFAKTFRMDQIT
jgi:hypothetical protein